MSTIKVELRIVIIEHEIKMVTYSSLCKKLNLTTEKISRFCASVLFNCLSKICEYLPIELFTTENNLRHNISTGRSHRRTAKSFVSTLKCRVKINNREVV